MAIPDTPLRLVHNVTLLPLAWAMLCQSAPTLLAILFMLLAALSNLRSHRLNLRLNYLSCHDALTGAFNRHYLERLEQGGELAEQIRLAVADHCWASIEPDLVVTISLGYHAHEAGIPLHEAVRRADVALYQAKANGRNRSERWQGDASGLAE